MDVETPPERQVKFSGRAVCGPGVLSLGLPAAQCLGYAYLICNSVRYKQRRCLCLICSCAVRFR